MRGSRHRAGLLLRALLLLGFAFGHANLVAGPAPIIVAQPLDVSVLYLGTASFSVIASSGTTMTYQWMKNGSNIPGATASLLSLLNVQPSDAGSYSVKVTNASGSVTSSAASLVVLSPPGILSQPQGQAVSNGQTFTLTVTASGSAPLSYRWSLNGTQIIGATGSSFTIANAQTRDTGNYTVTVSNPYGTVRSSAATVLLQTLLVEDTGAANATYDNLAASALDSFGNIIVAGNSIVSGEQAYVIAKYDRSGKLLWKDSYSPAARQLVAGLAVDSANNIFVTGSARFAGPHGGWNYLTVKYDGNGNQLWAVTFDGASSGADYASAVAVDHSGNVIVTGKSQGPNGTNQFCTVKYDGNGNQLWVQNYIGPGALEDDATAIAVDLSDNIYVTGKSKGTNSDFDYATIKYALDGTQMWVARYDGPASLADTPTAIAVGPDQNVYVTGASMGAGSDSDFATIKYGQDGSQLWVSRYNGGKNLKDQANALIVDRTSNVFVTGASEVSSGHSQYATIKYNSDGAQLWVQTYQGSVTNDDDATSLALDVAGDVYITGSSLGSSTGYDFATIKYNSLSGAQTWVARFNSGGKNNDSPAGVLVDNNYNVFVVGQSIGYFDCIIVRCEFGIYAPGIISSPQPCRIVAGQDASFSVVASGSEPLLYQWAVDGVQIAGATQSRLVLTTPDPGSTGSYSVKVSNSAGSVVSSSASLTVLNGPPILSVTNNGGGPNPKVFAFQFSTLAPGTTYVVEATTDLSSWIPIATNVTQTVKVVFTDPDAANFTSRFYRVVVK